MDRVQFPNEREDQQPPHRGEAGAGFVLLSALFVTLNRRHVMHVDHVGSRH